MQMKVPAVLRPPPRIRKKLDKLTRDPKNFFLDLRRLQPLWRRLGVETRHTRVQHHLQAARSPAEEANIRARHPELSSFDLVGDNWRRASEKPVAILVDFNPWKRELVAEYLPEYKTAFVRGRSTTSELIESCRSLRNFVFVVWGRGDDELVKFAAASNVALLRMEDGFIRSALLGSHHSTPCSLVLDSRGIYFDPAVPSDLEKLLNEYDFSASPQLLSSARSLLKLVRELGISKYNFYDFANVDALLGPRFKKRVLVIGQVESDASIVHGIGPDWTNLRLIRLAKSENPEAEIIYRPHPDVTNGFRNNAHTLRTLQSECRVLLEAVPIAELFRSVDRVYTMTSLSGLEALIHGVAVTVVGSPFYAGWGLTDDRVETPRRRRTLTIEELFCATYLLYPRYLGSNGDNVTGCLAAILHVTAHGRLLLAKTIGKAMTREAMIAMMRSEYWSATFRPSVKTAAMSLLGPDVVSALDLPRIFGSCRGRFFQRSVAYLLAGQFRKTGALPRLLKEMRGCIHPEHFQSLLSDLWQISPSHAVLENSAWALEKLGRFDEAQRTLEFLAEQRGEFAETREEIKPGAYVYTLRLGQLQLARRKLDQAFDTYNRLLLSGHLEGEVILGICEIARLRFDFASSAHLLKTFNRYDLHWKRGQAHVAEFRSHCLAGDGVSALVSIAIAITHNPQYVETIAPHESTLNRQFGILPYSAAGLLAGEREDHLDPMSRARALVAHHRPEAAEAVLRAYAPTKEELLSYCLGLSLACSYQGKLGEAKELVRALLPSFPVSRVYREGLRLAVLSNDYAWGRELVDEAAARGAYIGEMYVRKVAFGQRRIKDALLSFREMERLKVLPAYLGKRYIQTLAALGPPSSAERVLVVAFFGPGDEIRFASLYREMRNACAGREVIFTCDPRLQGLLERHYSDLAFLPVKRLRSLGSDTDLTRFGELPGSDLHTMFDNAGWQMVQQCDKVILATDAVGDVVDGYDSLKGTAYLKADPARINEWSTRLQRLVSRGRLLVGVSWRSSLNTYARTEHYFSVEDLAPLFEVPDVQFVNLQYDECSAELRWLEERYPGRILDFPDLDQFNDLDGVAALMSCLDLIIAPGTTVFELAAALGMRTWLLSNSSEFHWRKIENSDQDAWHSSLTHIESPLIGDKAALISITKDRLAKVSLGRKRDALAAA